MDFVIKEEAEAKELTLDKNKSGIGIYEIPESPRSAHLKYATEVEALRKESEALHAAEVEVLRKESEALHAAEVEVLRKESEALHASEVETLRKESEALHASNVEVLRKESEALHAAKVEVLRKESEALHATEVETLRKESEALHAAEVEALSIESEAVQYGPNLPPALMRDPTPQNSNEEKHKKKSFTKEKRTSKRKYTSSSSSKTDNSSSSQQSPIRSPIKKNKRSPKKSSKKNHKEREETPPKKSEKKKYKEVSPRKTDKSKSSRNKRSDSCEESEKIKDSPDGRREKSSDRKISSSKTRTERKNNKSKKPERKKSDHDSSMACRRLNLKKAMSGEKRNPITKEVEAWRKGSEFNLARTLFVCNLNPKTRSKSLENYFNKYGTVLDATVMQTQPRSVAVFRSRGFGFVKFLTEQGVEAVQTDRPHFLDGSRIITKRTLPLKHHYIHLACEQTPVMKVKNLGGKISRKELESYFSQHGKIISIEMAEDKSWAKITFDDYDPVDKVLMHPKHRIFGRGIKVEKCHNPMQHTESVSSSASNSPNHPAKNAKKKVKPPEQIGLLVAAPTPSNTRNETYCDRRLKVLKPTPPKTRNNNSKPVQQQKASTNPSVLGMYTVQEVCLRCFDCGCRDEVIVGCQKCLKKHLSMLCNDQQASSATNFKIQLPPKKPETNQTPTLASYITCNNNNVPPAESTYEPMQNCVRNLSSPRYEQVHCTSPGVLCPSPPIISNYGRNEQAEYRPVGRYNSQSSSDPQFLEPRFLSPENNNSFYFNNNLQEIRHMFIPENHAERIRQVSISPPPPPHLIQNYSPEFTDFNNRGRYHIESPTLNYEREKSPLRDYRERQRTPPRMMLNTAREHSPVDRHSRFLSPYRRVMIDPCGRRVPRDQSPSRSISSPRRRSPLREKSPLRRRSRSPPYGRSPSYDRSPLRKRSPLRGRSPPREYRGRNILSTPYQPTEQGHISSQEYTRNVNNEQEKYKSSHADFINREQDTSQSSSDSDVDSKRRKVLHSQLDGRLDKLLETCRRESIAVDQMHAEQSSLILSMQHPSAKDIMPPEKDNIKQKLEAVIQVCALLLKEHGPAEGTPKKVGTGHTI